MRYFFEIAYSGTNYHGWQNQANAIGVQQIVEDALSKLLREKTPITGSGRTDTGVHCGQQFFHADIEKALQKEHFLIRLNSYLPWDIVIRDFFPVKPSAHARYDARVRSYEYTISRVKDPFLHGQSYFYFRPLDVAAMNAAAELLIGEHDFQCFSKVKTDVNHFICSVTKAVWSEQKDILIFTITANRFLRGMVRAVVGTLLEVGTNKISVAQFKQIISAKDRKNAGANVPPEGLKLVRVKYTQAIYADGDVSE